MPDIPIDCILIRFSDISHLFCRSRDSTLRAIALTSSRNLSRWQPLLLQAVSLSKISVKSFMSLDPEKGDMVKSFRFHHHPNFDEDGEVRITLSPAPDDLRDKTQARELAPSTAFLWEQLRSQELFLSFAGRWKSSSWKIRSFFSISLSDITRDHFLFHF